MKDLIKLAKEYDIEVIMPTAPRDEQGRRKELAPYDVFADMLEHFSITATEAQVMDSVYWRHSAKLCGLKVTPELKKMTIEVLKSRESNKLSSSGN